MTTTASPSPARNMSFAAAFVILALLSSTSTTVAARHQSRCPSHCRPGGWGPGELLRLPECVHCSPPPTERAAAVSSSSSSSSAHPLDDVERAAEPTDIRVNVADGKAPRYGEKESCAKWCRFVPPVKWIPECKDCGDTGSHDAASSSAALGKSKSSTQQQRQRHEQAKKKRDGSSSWLIDFILSPFRRSRHHENRALRAGPAPAPGCAAWCKLVKDKKAMRWIPECLGCPANLHATTASAADNKKERCVKWCDWVSPAAMKLVPPCMGCDVPEPTGECPFFCTYIPVKEAKMAPACSSCYANTTHIDETVNKRG